MLTVHHLQISQSERILFLLEEMGVPYKLVIHERLPTGLAPQSIKEINEAGTAPVIEDEDAHGQRVVIGESGAIVEYILSVYGKRESPLEVRPGAPNYPQYLEWLHSANGTLQPTISRTSLFKMVLGGDPAQVQKLKEENLIFAYIIAKDGACLARLDKRLAQVPYLAGDQFTAADCMTVFSLTTMRGISPIDLTPYPNILVYLQRIGQREAYQRAMKKGDPNLKPLLDAKVERLNLIKSNA